jgi:hypothetical protein
MHGQITPGSEISRNGSLYQRIFAGECGFALFEYWIYGARSSIMEMAAAFP